MFIHSTPSWASHHPLEHIAHRDAVTNLPNRFLLADRVRQALHQSQRRGQALALAYLDLAGLQAINTTHGHAVGDEFLVSLSHRMKDVLREGDTLARTGAEEFVAVLVDLDAPQDGEPVLDRLVTVASNPVKVGEFVLKVSASIGVTLYPEGVVDVDLLLRHADQARVQKKKVGENRYKMFDLDLNSRMISRGAP